MTALSSVVGKVPTRFTQNQQNLRGSRVICPRKLSRGSFFSTICPEMLAGRFSIQLGISSLIRRVPTMASPRSPAAAPGCTCRDGSTPLTHLEPPAFQILYSRFLQHPGSRHLAMELGHMQRLPGGPVQVHRYTITPFLTRYTRELTAPVALLGVSSPPDPCAGPRR